MELQEFQEALSELEVAIMLDSNCFQALLMSGLCFEKLENVEKAEENYLYAWDVKKDDPTVNKQLYQLYLKLEQFEKAQSYIENIVNSLSENKEKVKNYEDWLIKLLVVYENSFDMEKTHKLLTKILEREDISDFTKASCAKSYFKIAVDSESLNTDFLDILVDNFENIEQSQVIDEIIEIVMGHMFQNNSIQERVDICFQKIHHLSTSLAALEQQFDLYLYYAMKNVKIIEVIAQKSLAFLCQNQYQKDFGNKFGGQKPQNYSNYQEKNENLYKRVVIKAQYFVNVYLAMLVNENSYPENIEIAKKLKLEHSLSNIILPKPEDDEPFFLKMEKELKTYTIAYLFDIQQAIDNQDFLKAKQHLDQLLYLINGQSDKGDISYIEDLHTKLGLQVFDDLDSLLQVKVICKTRLNVDFSNLEMLKCYYDCMQKLLKNFNHYDPEVHMPAVVQEILKLEPDNRYFLGEQIWLEFSQKRDYKQAIEKLTNLLAITNAQYHKIVLSKIQKRLGTLKLVFKQYENLNEISDLWESAKVNHPVDFQIYMCLGQFYEKTGDLEKALLNYQESFIQFQYDIFINKNLFFILSKLNKNEQALDFVERIETAFDKIFWVNYVLSLSYTNTSQFSKAEQFITRAIHQFQQDERRTQKSYYEKIQEFNHDQEHLYAIPLKIEQNDILFLDDYPIHSDQFWEKEANILSNSYPQINPKQKLYKLYIQQSQIVKMKGMIGSSLKSIQEAQNIIYQAHHVKNAGDKIMEIYNGSKTHELSNKIAHTNQLFEKIFLKTANLDIGQLDLQNFGIEGMLLQLEYAQVFYFSQENFACTQKIRNALLLGVFIIETAVQQQQQDIGEEEVQESKIIQQVRDLYNRTLSLIYEVGNRLVLKTWTMQNKAQGNEIYTQFCQLESLSCDNFIDFIILSEFYLLGFLITGKEDNIIYCIAHLESGLKSLDIDEQDLKVDEQGLEKLNNLLNNMNDRQVSSFKGLLADIIFSHYKLYEINKEEASFKKAYELSKVGILLFPDSILFYNYYGLLSKDDAQKIGAFLKSIQIDSENCIAIDNMAELYFRNGKYEESAKLFLKSIEISPRNTKAYMGIIVISLIYGIDYIRVLNKNYENNMKKFPYYRAQQDFFFEKCRSYLNFVQEFESSENAVFVSSLLQFLEYNNQIHKKLENAQLPYSVEKTPHNQELLLNVLNLQLIGKPNTSEEKQKLQAIFDKSICKYLNFQKYDLNLFNSYFNIDIKTQFPAIFPIFSEKVQRENLLIVKKISNSRNVTIEAEFNENLTDNNHYEIINEFYEHLKNVSIFLNLGILTNNKEAKEIFLEMMHKISTTNCHILFKNTQRFCDLYQLQIEIANNYYHYLCQFYEQDKNEINDDIRYSLIVLSNAKQLIQKQPQWVFFQFDQLLEDVEIINMGDYYYLLGVHAQKQQNHKLVKRKLFGSVLMAPQNIQGREALQSFQISIERKCVAIDYLSFINNSQYEKRIINYVNSEDVTLQQKIKYLSKGCQYLNQPNLWYLWVHYSFEDQNRHTKQFFVYLYKILKINVIEKLSKYEDVHDGIKKRAVKLLVEIYWKYKLTFLNLNQQENQQLSEIAKYLGQHQICIKNFSTFENSLLVYLNSKGIDLSQLKETIKKNPEDFSTLKLLFEICRKMFVTSRGKDLIQMLKEMKNLIINFEESVKTNKGLSKLYNMVQYIDSYIYLIAISEQYDPNSDMDKADIMEIVADASQNCLEYQNQSSNMIFIYMQYCYQNNIMEELNHFLDLLCRFTTTIDSKKDAFISGYFDLIYKFYQITELSEGDLEEQVDEFEQYVEYLKEDFYYQLSSSVKSMLLYLQGIVNLKTAEYDPDADEKSLMKNFKLAILYRPDFAQQILKNFK